MPDPTPPIHRPRVSVLMPVYNTAEYLPSALAGVASQSFTDFELLVVDDGSTDESRAILERFAKREPRMRLVARANRGLVATRNELLEMANGDLIAWMDSDDVSLPQRLATQVAELERRPATVCIGSAALCIDPDGAPLYVERFPLTDGEIRQAQWEGGGTRFPTSMMRAAAARAVGEFRGPFSIGEDLDFLMRLAEQGELANLSDVLVHYRQHPASACARLGPQWAAHLAAIHELAKERRATGSDALQREDVADLAIPPGADRTVAAWELHAAWARAAAPHYPASARKHALTALRLAPLSLRAWRTLLRVLITRARS